MFITNEKYIHWIRWKKILCVAPLFFIRVLVGLIIEDGHIVFPM